MLLDEMSAIVMGLILTSISLIYTGFQLHQSRKIARGEFLLHLDEMFLSHIQTHIRLRPGGDWGDKKTGPANTEEWVSVEQYMGLFERINILVENKIIDIDTIDRMYGYRVINILNNKPIRKAKIDQEFEYWEDFIKLGEKIKKIRQNRSKWWYKLFKFLRYK